MCKREKNPTDGVILEIRFFLLFSLVISDTEGFCVLFIYYKYIWINTFHWGLPINNFVNLLLVLFFLITENILIVASKALVESLI